MWSGVVGRRRFGTLLGYAWNAISNRRRGGDRIDETSVDAGESVTTTHIDGDQPGGALAGDSGPGGRATESTDSEELRLELAIARDRLSFYEGFDRVIAENVRRSGELMLEMLAMRETVTASAERESRHERERIAAGLAELNSGLQAIRTQFDVLGGQVSNLRRSLRIEPGRAPEHRPDPQPVPEPAPAAPVAQDAGWTAPAAPVAQYAGWTAPQVIDVIAHNVNKATIALSLQRYLGALDTVAGVEAREFAEGILRMQVTAHRPITQADLSGWSEGGQFTVLQLQPNVVELTLENPR